MTITRCVITHKSAAFSYFVKEDLKFVALCYPFHPSPHYHQLCRNHVYPPTVIWAECSAFMKWKEQVILLLLKTGSLIKLWYAVGSVKQHTLLPVFKDTWNGQYKASIYWLQTHQTVHHIHLEKCNCNYDGITFGSRVVKYCTWWHLLSPMFTLW